MIKILFMVVSWLPLSLAHRLGGLLGRGLTLFSNDLRDTARTNIKHCFPDYSEAQQQQLVSQCLQEVGKVTFEAGALWLWPIDKVMPLVRGVSGEDLVIQAMARGNGVILAGPHLGAWEMSGLYCSTRWPMTTLYRPPRQPGLNQIMRQGRGRAGAKLVSTTGNGVRALYKALANGELIGILPDQDPGRGSGVFAPFFGVQANTMTLLSRLANKTGAAVFMLYAERLPNGQGYHLHFEETGDGLLHGDEVQKATQLNRAVEKCVLQHPAQYQWAYKRFKTRPEGEGRFY